jgi:hypothetical protein
METSKKVVHTFHVVTSVVGEVGPVLAEVLHAQREDDEAVSHPRLERLAEALIELCRQLDNPVVWPVGRAAERLTGSAIALAVGQLRVRGADTDLTDQPVLLVTVTAVTPIPLLDAAEQAHRLGVGKIYGCGVRVEGLQPGPFKTLDSYMQLA